MLDVVSFEVTHLEDQENASINLTVEDSALDDVLMAGFVVNLVFFFKFELLLFESDQV
jgi:hypothetical protein